MKIYTIPQNQSGNITDLASKHFDRDIEFRKGTKYAVVIPAYFEGKGYTTHTTLSAAKKAFYKSDYNGVTLIDDNGVELHSKY